MKLNYPTLNSTPAAWCWFFEMKPGLAGYFLNRAHQLETSTHDNLMKGLAYYCASKHGQMIAHLEKPQ